MEPNEREFAEIVRQHKSSIYTVCYMFSKDEDEVADLFQEILINLWNGLGKFRGDCSMNSWLYKVALNTCLSAERKKKKLGKKVELSMDINLYEDNDADTKQIRQLYNRINRLGVVDRAIVLLWLDNMSYDEIGEIVGISTKNVSVKLVRIREQLKAMK
ncbi:MAG: sigma-70 family RNA polymerase sigma factor [Bacteroidaceae bacterium]|nr:sigma-70 family RNA polymerase sigma factor [Bacteroidaceae bacterium]